jgi:hypothetical protein
MNGVLMGRFHLVGGARVWVTIVGLVLALPYKLLGRR